MIVMTRQGCDFDFFAKLGYNGDENVLRKVSASRGIKLITF
jgi:hypothetical protein